MDELKVKWHAIRQVYLRVAGSGNMAGFADDSYEWVQMADELNDLLICEGVTPELIRFVGRTDSYEELLRLLGVSYYKSIDLDNLQIGLGKD